MTSSAFWGISSRNGLTRGVRYTCPVNYGGLAGPAFARSARKLERLSWPDRLCFGRPDPQRSPGVGCHLGRSDQLSPHAYSGFGDRDDVLVNAADTELVLSRRSEISRGSAPAPVQRHTASGTSRPRSCVDVCLSVRHPMTQGIRVFQDSTVGVCELLKRGFARD